MKRYLSNWIESYCEYTNDTESSPLFNTWVGLSVIASALKKKTWLHLGRIRVYPNLYVILVAEPGVARKTQSINYGMDLIKCVPKIITSADSATAFGLMQELEDAIQYDAIPGHPALRHTSLSVISREFESFIGTNSKMLVTLTDLFDAGENVWKHRTKSQGIAILPAVYLNILGATTPRSLDACMSSIAIGGGLTSRIIFVYSSMKMKKVAIPRVSTEMLELKGKLVHDLELIERMAGEFTYSTGAEKYWTDWYMAYDERGEREQKNSDFDGWYSRKPLMIQKVSIILAASQGLYEICVDNVEQAIKLIEEVEKDMDKIMPCKAVVASNTQLELVYKYIKQYKFMAEPHLLQLVWREVDEQTFDDCIDKLIKDNKCEREFRVIEGKESIWYKLKEEADES